MPPIASSTYANTAYTNTTATNPVATNTAGVVSPPSRRAPLVLAIVAAVLIGAIGGFFTGRAYERDATASPDPATTRATTATTRPPGDTIAPSPTPSGPTSTAPTTSIEPSTLGSEDDPIPLRQAYVLGDYQIEVIAADLDAFAALAAHDPGNPAPAEGSRRVLVEVTITYVGSAVGNTATIPFFLTDRTATWNDIDAGCGNVPDNVLEGGTLGPGDDFTGHTCFTVPVDAGDDLLFGTEGFAGPVHFAIA